MLAAMVDLRETFGDIDEDLFEPGSPLIGRGAWIDDDDGDGGDGGGQDAPHPEWEPFEPDEAAEEEPPAEEPEAAPIPKADTSALVDRGERLVARFAVGVDGFNTIEVGAHFELSA